MQATAARFKEFIQYRPMLHTCSACRREIQSRISTLPKKPFRKISQKRLYATTQDVAPRVGIIGSGPAGFYAARRLLNKMSGSKVDMYESLPTPFGLVRFGVAPDHPEVKNCIDVFTRVASHPSFTFIGNVSIGDGPRALPLRDLAQHYDALLFAYGASKDKKLCIPGENLKDVLSARAFVGWYNGLPEYANLKPDLQRSADAIIIGQGNVALDVARILLSSPSRLRHTDITEEAFETLQESRITNVQVVGRRGPLQAAHTTKELRELMGLREVSFEMPDEKEVLPQLYWGLHHLSKSTRRQAQLIFQGKMGYRPNAMKRWSLQYLLSPTAFETLKWGPGAGCLGRVRFTRNEYIPQDTKAEKAPGASVRDHFLGWRVRPAVHADPVSMNAGIAFRSIGYKSEALDGFSECGIPFDDELGIIPNDSFGRILSPDRGPGEMTAGHVPGMYAAGWVKRGPTGVIASTMEDAFTTADALQQDWQGSAKFLQAEPGRSRGWEAVKQVVEGRNIRSVSWKDWCAIDREEVRRGKSLDKRREKCRSVEEMLQILDGGVPM